MVPELALMTSSSGPKPPTCFTSGMITSAQRCCLISANLLPPQKISPAEMRSCVRRLSSAYAGPIANGSSIQSSRARSKLGKNRVEVLRTDETLVEVDADPEIWELLPQMFQRCQACGALRDGAIGAVHGFEGGTLEDFEALPADLRHDR